MSLLMTPTPTEDRDAIAAVLAGDVEAFEVLVRRYQPGLEAYLRCHAPEPTQADDLVQVAFVTAFRSLARFDVEQPFEPWLFGIGRNLLRKAWDRAARDARRRGALERRVRQHLGDAAQARPADESAARVAALRACVGELPERWAAIVRARYEESEPVAAIAERLESTAASVAVSLHRIRARLRECIGRRLTEDLR